MEIREGTQLIKNNTQKAIIEFVFSEYIIFVFQGTLSEFDILVKYRKDGTRIRTPKHIHWVVDVLMKMQAKEALTKKFLEKIRICWNESEPLRSNDFYTLKELIEDGEERVNIDEFKALDKFGEYDVEFLYVLMELLSVQEKTNRNDAYLFGEIIEQLLETEKDIFSIISKAGFGGRRG